jgi:hypothetical protein
MGSVPQDLAEDHGGAGARQGDLARFREVFYSCLSARADAQFELTDALLCADGPVRSLVDLSLAPEHRRGHGALYAGLNHGSIEIARLRRSLTGLVLPRVDGGDLRRLVVRRRFDVVEGVAAALDLGDDVRGGGLPHERARVGVPVRRPGSDRGGEVGDAGEHSTAQPLVGQFLEPAFD